MKKARTNMPEESVTREPARAEVETVMPNMGTVQQRVAGGESRNQIEARINAMKYRDIQVECKQYGLLAMGNKEVLRERLLAHLLDEESQAKEASHAQVDRDSATSPEPMEEERDVSQEKKADESNSEDVIMQDEAVVFPTENKDITTFESVDKVVANPPARISCSSVQADVEVPMMDSEIHEEKLTEKVVVDNTSKDPPGKAIEDSATSVGPDDFGSRSPLAGFVKDALKSMAASAQSAQKSSAFYSDSIPEDDVSPPPSDFTTSTTSSKISGTRVRELVSKLSNPSNSALSKSVQAKKEARMARMAEMRGKVRGLKIVE